MVKKIETTKRIIEWQCEICTSIYGNKNTANACENNCADIEKGRMNHG